MAFKMITDNWVGPQSNNREQTCMSVDEAIKAVTALNGVNLTQVVLKRGDRTLIIGGGNEKKYNVVLTIGEDEEFYTLIDSAESPGDQTIIVTGGQAGSFPRNQAVTLSAAVTAVHDFVRSGELSVNLTWQHE